MRKKKRILSMLLSAFMLAAVLPPIAAPAEEAVQASPAASAGDGIAAYSSTSAVMTLDAYDAKLSAIAQSLNTTDPSVLADSQEYKQTLFQRRLVEKAGYDTLTAKMSADPDFAETIEWLFSDYEMLHNYIFGGDPESNAEGQSRMPVTSATYISSFQVLTRLYTKYKTDVGAEGTAPEVSYELTENPALYKRLMAALALNFAVPLPYWLHNNYRSRAVFKWIPHIDAVNRYEFYRKFYSNGFLVDVFAEYNTEELRMVTGTHTNEAQLEWTQHYYRSKSSAIAYKNADGTVKPKDQIGKATASNLGGLGVGYTINEIFPTNNGAKYYDPKNYDMWNARYDLEEHDEYFDYIVEYGPNEKGQYYAPHWIELAGGGVCGDISNMAAVLLNAFGLAGRPIYQSPDHMSYLVYNRNGGNPVVSSGYDVYGMSSSSTIGTTKGCLKRGHAHLINNWGNQAYAGIYYNVGYIFMAMDSIYDKHGTSLEKARVITFMGDIEFGKGNFAKAEELYEAALDAQYFYLDAFIGLANVYKATNKTDEEYYALIETAAENMQWYPTAMYEYIMNLIYPQIKEPAVRSDVLSLVRATLTKAASSQSNSAGLAQPAFCREYANFYLRRVPNVVAFSFDTGNMTLSSAFSATDKNILYSFDGGNTWNTWERTSGDVICKLPEAEIAQITDEKDITVKFEGAKRTHIIVIGTNRTPQTSKTLNTPNDDEDKFVNLQRGLEYSVDSGATWQPLTSEDRFEGDFTVWVRIKATGAFLAGGHFVATFTQSDTPAERRYLPLSGNVKLTTPYPSAMRSNPYSNAVDGRVNTFWLNFWTTASVSDGKGGSIPAYPNTDFIFEINEPHYISGVGYIPAPVSSTTNDATISSCEVYVSNDKAHWELVGSTNNWINAVSGDGTIAEQGLTFDEPAYAKYVKIKILQAGTRTLQVERGYAAVAEYRLYENKLCPNKEVDSLEIDNAKVEYKVGDKLDYNTMTVRVRYKDGTTSLVPASVLEFSEDVLNSTDIKEVHAWFNGVKTTFRINVNANDRTATRIVGVTLNSDQKHYANTKVAKDELMVLVTDGTDTWYLMPEEFEIEDHVLAQGNNTVKVTAGGLSGTVVVNADKAVKELRIDKATEGESFKEYYYVGDALDLTGMTVSLVYSDDEVRVLDESEYEIAVIHNGTDSVEEADFSKLAGTKTIRSSLKNSDLSASVDVTVFNTFSSGKFSFESVGEGTTCKLTKYTPAEGEDVSSAIVSIPETVNVGGFVYTVTEIGGGAFDDAAAMTSVSIPKTVESIEQDAFSSCTELTDVYMSDYSSFANLSCGNGAFAQVEGGRVFVQPELASGESPIEGYTLANIYTSTRDLAITAPSKTEYILGEELDTSGMSVEMVLFNGTHVETTEYVVRGFNPGVSGEQTVTVALTGDLSVTGTFKVNVSFPPLEITKQPATAAYFPNDEIKPLSIEAVKGENFELGYQWYRSETNDKNGTAIENATSETYIPTQSGYYYAAVYMLDRNNTASEAVYSNIASIQIGDFTAFADGIGYYTLEEAMQSVADRSTVTLYKDVEISEGIDLSGKRFTLEGNGHTLTRSNNYKKYFILLQNSSDLTLKNITFDGGAVWTGEEDPVLKRGATNSGLTATCPFVFAYTGTTLTISEGAVLQNNYNTGANASANGIVKDNLTGGAVWGTDATVTLDGGAIINNASTVFGSAVYIRGNSIAYFNVNNGEISGNQDPNPTNAFNASAVCIDNKAIGTIIGGTFKNNKGGKTGGVFMVGNNSLKISDGTFEDNYVYGDGTVGCVFGSGTITVTGGTYKNNYATGNGGAFYSAQAKTNTFKNAVFENNYAGGNGGVICNNSTGGIVDLNSNTFKGNTAAGNGGVVYSIGRVNTTQDSFDGNAAQKGNSMYFAGSNANAYLTSYIIKGDNLSDIYMENLQRVRILADNKGKPILADTATAIADGTVVAQTNSFIDQVIRVNGYSAVCSEDPAEYKKYGGYPYKAVITPRVTYNKNGGAIENEIAYTIYQTDSGLTLPIPTKAGYSFAGWYESEDLSGEAITAIEAGDGADKIYWAKWAVAQYSVTLNADGGSYEGTLDKYTFGEGAELPVPQKDGAIFAGWFDNAEFKGEAVTAISDTDSGDKTYWAKWADAEYNITFNVNGGVIENPIDKYTYGQATTLPIPSRTHYDFGGWYDNAELTGNAIAEIGEHEFNDKQYWAKWTKKRYTARFVNYDGTLLYERTIDAESIPMYNSTTEPMRPADDRYTYTFAGWEPQLSAILADTTYTAQYTQTPRVYSLTLNLDGGMLDNEAEYRSYTYGVGVTLPTPVRTQYLFGGWFDNAALSGNAVTAISNEEFGNKAFWASWSYIAPSEFDVYFVNYNDETLQYGKVAKGETPVYSGETPVKPSDDKYSYEFIGWDKELTAVEAATTYTAQFKATPITCFIEYRGDDIVLSATKGEYYVVFVAYDANGRPVSIDKVIAVFDEAGEMVVEPKKFNTNNSVTEMVMVFNTLYDLKPVCDPAVKTK